MKVEFVLAGDSTPVGSKEMDAIPQIDDEVEIDGKVYKVEDQPRDASAEHHTVWVRRVAD